MMVRDFLLPQILKKSYFERQVSHKRGFFFKFIIHDLYRHALAINCKKQKQNHHAQGV